LNFLPTPIDGVMLIEPKVFGDARGFFMETWREDAFAKAGIGETFVQDNHSRSGRGVLRGLHYQLPNPQGKLVRVTTGAVFDVVVDMRASSPTFGRWFGAELSEANHRMLWAPPGMAHGFLTLSDTVDFVYKCTALYAPADERAVRWNDPALAIDWPLTPGQAPTVSAKDAAAPPLADATRFP
jgi:dTDP-4-dehydrorhamnose 3,5-epimerase